MTFAAERIVAVNSEIAFIDANIPDLDTFLCGLRPGLEAILLSPNRPAPAQIADALCGRSSLDAIHIVAHGAPGTVNFSSGALKMETLNEHAADLAKIGDALSPHGELLLWSCYTGDGTQGAAFIDALERVAGSPVAASTNLVGSFEKGGCWELSAGNSPAARVPLAPQAAATYPGVLLIVDLNGPADGTSDTTNYVEHAENVALFGDAEIQADFLNWIGQIEITIFGWNGTETLGILYDVPEGMLVYFSAGKLTMRWNGGFLPPFTEEWTNILNSVVYSDQTNDNPFWHLTNPGVYQNQVLLTVSVLEGTVAFPFIIDTTEVSTTASIIPIAINDAPTASAPVSYTAVEQTPLILGGTGLSIADVDASPGLPFVYLTVVLSVTDGTLSASAGTTGVGVSGSGTSSLTLTGPLAQINTLLAAGGNSTLSYISNSGSSATLTMTVHDNGLTGGGDLTAVATAVIDVTPVNDAPIAVADTGSAGENEIKSFAVLANDTDVDVGDTKTLTTLGAITVTSANGSVNGINASSAFTIVGNQIQFTPGTLFDRLDFNDTASVAVNYTMQDSQGAPSSSTLTLTVNGANDTPVAVANTGSAGENEIKAFDVLVNDTDVDTSDTKTLTILGAISVTSANASVNGIDASSAFEIVGNEIQFTAGTLFDALDFDDTATVVVNYTMQDSQGATSSSILTLTVGATPVPIGNDIQVNTTTADTQISPSVAALADGGFVVVWKSSDGSDSDIFGQRFDASGAAQGSEFQVNTATLGSQELGSVAALADGGFVVTWVSFDGSGTGISGQRYDESGVAVGSEFSINTTTLDFQYYPSVTSVADGGFVVTWSSSQEGDGTGIYGQRYDATGAPLGNEFHINTTTAFNQQLSAVASLSNGGFVVTWSSQVDGFNTDIFGQRYDATGTAVGGEFRANTYTIDFQGLGQNHPSVTGLADGGFVVTWQSWGQDVPQVGWSVHGQRYDASGTAIGSEFLASPSGSSAQGPSVASLSDGGFVVTWVSFDGSGTGIYAQRYAANGMRAGSEFLVNQITAGDQGGWEFYGSEWVTQLADGQLVATWGPLFFGPEEIFFRLIDVPASGFINAPAMIGGTVTGSVTEDTILTASGVLTITDPDAGHAAFTAGPFAGDFGTLDLTQAGEWTYTLANANSTVQALGSGQSLQDVVAITSVDGTTKHIFITINGVNEQGSGKGQTIDGTSGNDQITTGNNDDVINAGGGDDIVVTGNGNDLVQAGSGNDTVHGGNGTDTLYGDAGDDALFGDAGKDIVHGGAGADEIHGGDGADTLFGDAGNDILIGDAGNDKFVFASGFGSDTISDFDFNPAGGGQDLLDISAFGITSATFASRVGLTDLGTDIQVTIDGEANQTIVLQNVQLVSSITQTDFILS